LLAVKTLATSFSDSLAIFSETINSLTDVVASIAVVLCVRMGARSADEDHPFGHRRAEPVAGLVVAIFTAIMGWHILQSTIPRFLGTHESVYIGPYPIPALLVTIITKLAMAWYLSRVGRQINSPALRASSVDCRNDVLVGGLALGGVLAGYRLPLFDSLAAAAVGIYVIYQAFQIGVENFNYLVGKAAEPELRKKIIEAAEKIPGVNRIGEVKAHYVGNFIQVELNATVDGQISTADSHEIAENIRSAVEAIDTVDYAFIHIEPETLSQNS
jgi:cation diffusion facilitator family transporter